MEKNRLIDADNFLDLFYVASAGQDKAFVSAVEMVAEDTPTIDAVEVVRCGECIHSARSPFGHPVLRWCPILDSHRRPDWFCADGRRAGDDV